MGHYNTRLLRQQTCSLLADTQKNPISDNVAKLMNIHQHLIIMTVKHILNIQEVSMENKKSKFHNNS